MRARHHWSCSEYGRRPDWHSPLVPAVVAMAIAGTAACSSRGHDIYDDFNNRDTGQYKAVSRNLAADGAVLIHIEAEQPEHGRELAWELVRLSYATSPRTVRVVVDPAHEGSRQVFLWEGGDLRVDTSTEGLPAPRADRDHSTPRP